MADAGGIVGPLAFVYGAALAALPGSLVIRARARRAGRTPSLAEAGWAVFLPALSVAVLPLAALLAPHPVGPAEALHRGWHAWAANLVAIPLSHALLHGATGVLLIVAVLCLARAAYLLARMRGFSGALRAASAASGCSGVGEGLYLLDSPRPLCFTLGFLRPVVYLTTGLRACLAPRELDAMLAHEAAHVRRRDGLIRAFLVVFYAVCPLPGARLLLADWDRAVERACDAAAARAVGDPCDVAAALVRVAGLGLEAPSALPGAPWAGACFTADPHDIEGRVRALLEGPGSEEASVRHASLPSLGIAAGSLVAGALWLPHLVDLLTRH